MVASATPYSEASKIVGVIGVANDSSWYFTVNSPTTSASNCFLTILQVPATSPARNMWLDELRTAKEASRSVSVNYDANAGVCTVSGLVLN
jgi:hypothetical protein